MATRSATPRFHFIQTVPVQILAWVTIPAMTTVRARLPSQLIWALVSANRPSAGLIRTAVTSAGGLESRRALFRMSSSSALKVEPEGAQPDDARIFVFKLFPHVGNRRNSLPFAWLGTSRCGGKRSQVSVVTGLQNAGRRTRRSASIRHRRQPMSSGRFVRSEKRLR